MTYVAIVVELVIRQLELVKRDDLFRPLRAFRRRVGVHVYPRWRVRVRFAGYHPARADETYSVKSQKQCELLSLTCERHIDIFYHQQAQNPS